jgi:hypothetical protein
MIIQKSSFYSKFAARQRGRHGHDNRGNRFAAPDYLQARLFIVSRSRPRRIMPLAVEKLVLQMVVFPLLDLLESFSGTNLFVTASE